MPLAVSDTIEIFSSEPIGLDPGDTVLLLTDGVLEVRSPEGEFFGIERTLQAVRENLNHSSSEIVDSLFRTARDFSGRQSQSDDLTIMVLKA